MLRIYRISCKEELGSQFVRLIHNTKLWHEELLRQCPVQVASLVPIIELNNGFANFYTQYEGPITKIGFINKENVYEQYSEIIHRANDYRKVLLDFLNSKVPLYNTDLEEDRLLLANMMQNVKFMMTVNEDNTVFLPIVEKIFELNRTKETNSVSDVLQTKNNYGFKLKILSVIFFLITLFAVVLIAYFLLYKDRNFSSQQLNDSNSSLHVQSNEPLNVKDDLTNLVEDCEVRNNYESCLILGKVYYEGTSVSANQSVKQDYLKALQYFEKSCDGSLSHGCRKAGIIYYSGQGVTQNIDKAHLNFSRGCELKDPTSCFNDGLLFEPKSISGNNTHADNEQSFESYKKGCTLNDSDSCNKLGLIYELGIEPVASNISLAIEKYSKACDIDKFNCNNLGKLYFDGLKVTKNEKKALDYFTMSCNQKNAIACYNVYLFYKKDNNNKLARKYLQIAKDYGYDDSLLNEK